MIASKRNWRKFRKPYNPLWYKGLHREKPKKQPCPKDCRCKACVAYHLALATCDKRPVLTLLGVR